MTFHQFSRGAISYVMCRPTLQSFGAELSRFIVERIKCLSEQSLGTKHRFRPSFSSKLIHVTHCTKLKIDHQRKTTKKKREVGQKWLLWSRLMIFSIRPKPIQRFLISSPSTLQCFSTSLAPRTPIPTHKLHQQNPDYELALVSCLKQCASCSAIVPGRLVHGLVLRAGMVSNSFIQNSLINMYAKCGFIEDARCLFDSCLRLDPVSFNIMISGYVKLERLNDARHLFDIMPKKGCVSYTTMIMGFAQNGYWREAFEFFKDMRCTGVVPNEVTLASLISASLHISSIRVCRMLHALVAKMLLDKQVLVSTNMLNMYCVCSSLSDAIKLFNEMPERNIVSWNVLLNGYSKAGLIELARNLFEEIPSKDVVSWGTMIDGYVQVDSVSKALTLYRGMLRDGLRPSDVMVVGLVSACARVLSIREGLQLHSTIAKAGFDCYDFVQATVIHFYAACARIDLACLQYEVGVKDHLASRNALLAGFMRNGMIEQARKLFNEMPERDVTTWSTIISGYAQSKQPNTAIELFHEMVATGLQPNPMTMVSVFSAIASAGKLIEGIWAHEYAQQNSIDLNDNLSAAIIDMYAKCGSLNTALEVFSQIREKACNVSPWNAIICGLAMHGHANLSLTIYCDLERRDHIEQNSITFLGVLSACCHAGLVEQARKYFKRMKTVYNINPNIKHYGCMVDLLGRAGLLAEAEEIIRTLPMKADIVIWGTLLAACRTHGNVDIGERAAENLARLQLSHGGGRVLLSNLYADFGRWEDVISVRRTMQNHRIEKAPGCSGVVWF